MSKLETISQFLHRVSQYVILALLSVVAFWVKDIYTDYKDTKVRVSILEAKVSVHAEKFESVQGQITEIKSRWTW